MQAAAGDRRSSPRLHRTHAPNYRCQSIRYGKCRKFICLQGNLLSKHDVAWDQITLGGEAQEWSVTSFEIDFLHVGDGSVLHSVPPPSRAADNVEVAPLFKLSPLSWR